MNIDTSFIRDKEFWRITGALCALHVTTFVMNAAVFPQFDLIFTYARDISVTANAAILLIVGLLAAFRPRLLHMRTFDALSVGALILGPLIMLTSLATFNAPTLIISSCLEAVGRAGVTVIVGLSAMRLNQRRALLAIISSFFFAYALRVVLWGLPVLVGIVLFFVLPLVAFWLTFRGAQPYLYEAATSSAPADIAIVRPSTFLPLTSHIFVCIFIFRLAFGYSLRFGEVSGVPVSDVVLVLPLAVLLVLFVFGAGVWAKSTVDLFVKVALLLVIIGFFLVPAPDPALQTSSSVALSLGNTLFDIVAWVLLISLASKNSANAVAVFAWGRGMAAIGTLVGALLGVWGNRWAAGQPDVLFISAGILLTALVAYALFGLWNYSFQREIDAVHALDADDTLRTHHDESASGTLLSSIGFGEKSLNVPNIMSAPGHVNAGYTANASMVKPPAPTHGFTNSTPAALESTALDERCHALAQTYGLSPRETEVFRMLAEGRDRAYIEEALVVSRNTVKAHVKHIYAKLDIHAHQDLIALVRGE